MLILFFALAINAQEINFGKPIIRGPGCESASAEINPQNKSIKINFKNFKAVAGKTTKSLLARKSCLVAIPVQVDKGTQVAIIHPKVLAQIELNKKSKGHVSVESFLAGSKGTKAEQNLIGPIDKSILVTNNDSTEWTQCGVSTNLRLNISVVAQASDFNQSAQVGIDSLPDDLQIKTKRCN